MTGLCTGSAAGEPADAASTTSGVMCVTEHNFPDPYLFKLDDDYFVFGTCGHHARFFRTRSFTPQDITWYRMKLDFGKDEGLVENVWAFRPYRHSDGSFHAYGSVNYGMFRTVIGHFVPSPGEFWSKDHPIQSWRMENIIIGSVQKGEFAYDSVAVRDEKNDLYLFYAAGHTSETLNVNIHVKVRKLLDPATLDPNFAPRPLLSPEDYRSEDRNPGFIQITEGPIPFKAGGKYLFFYSVGDFTLNNYKVGVAYSNTLVPAPGQYYQKILIPDPENSWKNCGKTKEIAYVLQSENKQWPNYIGDQVSGPGIANLVELGKQSWLVFHARMTDTPEAGRCLWRVPVKVNVAPQVPPEQWIQPLLPELSKRTQKQ